MPILPEAFLTFASKSSIGPSYAAYGPYTSILNVHQKLFPQKSEHEEQEEPEEEENFKKVPLWEGPK